MSTSTKHVVRQALEWARDVGVSVWVVGDMPPWVDDEWRRRRVADSSARGYDRPPPTDPLYASR